MRGFTVGEAHYLFFPFSTDPESCLGQGLHTMEDFGAHTNYCELALRELGYRDVFPHCGVATEINIRGESFPFFPTE
jgi:hypothetical protein